MRIPPTLLVAAATLPVASATTQDSGPETVAPVTLRLSESPIQCLPVLSAEELARRDVLTVELRKSVDHVVPIDDGYEVTFSRPTLAELVEWISLERRCCPFLTFELVFLPDAGGELLRVVGGKGVREFLATAFFPDVPRERGHGR